MTQYKSDGSQNYFLTRKETTSYNPLQNNLLNYEIINTLVACSYIMRSFILRGALGIAYNISEAPERRAVMMIHLIFETHVYIYIYIYKYKRDPTILGVSFT